MAPRLFLPFLQQMVALLVGEFAHRVMLAGFILNYVS